MADRASNPPRLQAKRLSWAVADRFVLLDVDLELDRATLAVVTGENGAGKSTLLDLLCGLRAPARGVVALDGVPLPEVDAGHLALRMARLGHRPGLYLDLTAHENVSLFAELSHRAAAPVQVAAQLESVGIAPRDQHRPVRGFSRGMLQRTALARILLGGADIWILDEPSTGLDARGTRLLVETLGAARDRGATIVVATHDPELLPLADRHLVVRHGRVEPAERAP